MKIDIREMASNPITSIQFGDVEYIRLVTGIGYDLKQNGIEIADEESEEEVTIYMEDLDNLIKALQKAKEIWT